ncbi:MAG: hypothetical protein HYR76_11840 [Ignavibacteria bacterium]|nr:hypothetical protein [Ignavibacteria bacterium]MBI3765536.1 hypothetical protein [Ignavibacteriales bacterium]
MKRLNPLKYLSRKDKWYLGGGNRLIWAPPFPVWLDYPGFWDKAHYYNFEIEPVFTWTILDKDGVEIPLRAVKRRWDPSKLTSRYEICDVRYKRYPSEVWPRTSHIAYPNSDIAISEDKCCLPNDVLTSVIHIGNTSRKRRKLHLVAWTIQPTHPSKEVSWLSEIEYENNKIQFTKHVKFSDRPQFQFDCVFGINRKVTSYSLNLSEGAAIQPCWQFTPFFERFQKGKLRNEIRLSGVTDEGLVFMALHTSIEVRAKSEEVIVVSFAAASNRAEANSNIHFISKQKDPVKVSEENWNDHFSSVPSFHCSDEYLTRYYWYRWYGLKLMTMNGQEMNYKYPTGCEGIGYFRAPISYSSPCHVLENRWSHAPDLAQGSLLTFFENQRNDGSLPGYIDVNHDRRDMFYHANWGNAIHQLYLLQPSNEFLRWMYPGLKKYAQYFDRERDEEISGMYDIHNHYETGQEYTHRYTVVNPHADQENWGKVFRLKGVDATVYIYQLKQTLSWIAKSLGLDDEAELWNIETHRIKSAVVEKMWDPDEEMFFDIDPANGRRTKVKAVTCFYPYMTDMVGEEHLHGLRKNLLDPKRFWTAFPVPSSSVDDEFFSAVGNWKGKRMNCPWNGRVWPMTNSHIAEALVQAAIRFKDQELRRKTVEFITKFIRMMFFGGDPNRPNCFEHYNPLTGEPSTYRGVDDYMHSWVVDLILKYVAGIQPFEGGFVLDPFPFRLKSLSVADVLIQGHRVAVKFREGKYSVWVDGKLVRSSGSEKGKPLTISFAEVARMQR